MSERELRRVLQEVMEDIDAGRLRAPPLRPTLTRRFVGPVLLATGLGLAGAGCIDRSVGLPRDGGVDAAIQLDAGSNLVYAEPFDAGPMPEYMSPEVDAEVIVDAGVYLYDAPPQPDAEPDADGLPQPMYGFFCDPPAPDDGDDGEDDFDYER